MVILPVHQGDAHILPAKGFGAFQTGEAGAEDDDVGTVVDDGKIAVFTAESKKPAAAFFRPDPVVSPMTPSSIGIAGRKARVDFPAVRRFVPAR